MRVSLKRRRASQYLLAGLLATGFSLAGRPTPAAAPMEANNGEKAAEASMAPPSLAEQVQAAFRSADGIGLLSIAEQLESGEIKGAMTPRQVRLLAVRVVVARGDKDLLEKLDAAAAKSKDQSLTDRLAAARVLLSESRAAMKSPAVSIDDISEEGLRLYRMLSQDIAAAEMSQDVEQIDVLIGVIPAFSELPASVRDHLLARAKEVKKSLPERQDEDLSLLSQLDSGSRDGQPVMIETNGRQTKVSPGQWVNVPPGGKVVNIDIDAYKDPGVKAGVIAIHTSTAVHRSGGTPGAYLMVSKGLPLCLVAGGKRIQWATTAGALFTRDVRNVTSAQYHAVPGFAEIARGAKVLSAPGRPGALLAMDGKTILPFDDLSVMRANGSSIFSVSTKTFDTYRAGPSLFIVR